ncbi:MAG: DUF255 domain-containing protein [Phycisphaerales bacterium]
MRLLFASITVLLLTLLLPQGAFAQNPVQWGGNAKSAIERAQSEHRPLLFWVSQGRDGDDEDDLEDAQSDSFRDPIVVSLAQKDFIPVRVSRNSRMLEEAQKLGLPTTHGLYVALLSPDGKVLDQIDPGVVANPQVFATRLVTALRSYRDSFYRDQLQKVVTAAESAKRDVRTALQFVWRLRILTADKDVIALMDRKDLLPTEKRRLYQLMAAMCTQATVEKLLSLTAQGDKDAEGALAKAEPGALEFLLPHLPTAEGADATQLAAYDAAARIARFTGSRSPEFWKNAKPEDRTKEIDLLRGRAATVLEYWQEQVGRWR